MKDWKALATRGSASARFDFLAQVRGVVQENGLEYAS